MSAIDRYENCPLLSQADGVLTCMILGDNSDASKVEIKVLNLLRERDAHNVK